MKSFLAGIAQCAVAYRGATDIFSDKLRRAAMRANKNGVTLKEYMEHSIPIRETLAMSLSKSKDIFFLHSEIFYSEYEIYSYNLRGKL